MCGGREERGPCVDSKRLPCLTPHHNTTHHNTQHHTETETERDRERKQRKREKRRRKRRDKTRQDEREDKTKEKTREDERGRHSLKRASSHKKRAIVHKTLPCLRDCFVSIVSWDEDGDIMNSCGARVCGMTFSLRECECRSEWREIPSHFGTHVRRLGHARCSKTSLPCCTHKTKRRRHLVRSLSIPTSVLSRAHAVWISAQQDATTSGRVILCCRLTLESRPEERVQQVEVWRSGRLEDDVPSREWHVFFKPRLGTGNGMRGALSRMHKKLSMAAHSGIVQHTDFVRADRSHRSVLAAREAPG